MSARAVDLARQGADAWNQWRRGNPTVVADLRNASLRGAQLRGADLNDALLSGADLSYADLHRADLSRADLRASQLTGADLRDADLRCAILADLLGREGTGLVDITNADFTGARFGWTIVGDVYLNRMTGLGHIRHAGPSYIATSTLELTAREIRSTGMLRTDVESFLRGAGVLLESFRDFERALRSHSFYSAFISYSHADKEFAYWLHSALEREGIRCWLDEKNLLPGERIADAIGKAISSHERLLLVCSKSSLESWWVQDELRKIQELERAARELRVIPLTLDDYLLSHWQNGLAADLRSRLALDFQEWKTSSGTGLKRLVAGLQRQQDSVSKPSLPAS
jgi:hypothetical protein